MAVQFVHCHCCGTRALRADLLIEVEDGYCKGCREGLGKEFQRLLGTLAGKHMIEALPYELAAMALKASGNQLYRVKLRGG